MFNKEQHQSLYNNTVSPRISFSNDFADPQLPMKLETSYREAPVSSDFEFSAPTHNMISADKLFFNGKMLPMRASGTKTTTTLRDELLAGEKNVSSSSSIFKGASRWRERLGLKRSSVHHKRADKNAGGSLESIDEVNVSEIS